MSVTTMAQDAVWLDVLPSMKNFGSELAKGAGKEAEKQGKATGQVYGKALLAGVAVVAGGAALAGKALYGIGETFDDMTDTIRVGTGAVGKDLDGLVESAKNVGTRVPADFDQIGVALADVNTRLGLTGQPLEDMSSQFLELSRITGTDVATNIEKVTRVFGDWGISAEEQGDSLDYLFKVSQSTGVGVDELSDKVVQFGAPMRQLGFDFDETAALMGKWGKEGVNTETIMGGLRQGLGKMAKAGKEPAEEFQRVSDAIKNAGTEGEATQIAIETFGQRAGPDLAAAVREGRFELDDLMGTLDESGETIMGAGEDTMDFAEQWQMFRNEIMTYVEPAATKLFEVITDGMSWIRDTGIPAIKDFTSWLQENKATIIAGTVAVGALVVAWGTMTILTLVRKWLDGMTLSQKLLNLAMKANPILLVVGLIGTLVTALVWLYNNNEDARRIMDAAWKKIKGAIDTVVKWFKDTAWPWMRDTFTRLSEKAEGVRDRITDAWDRIRSGISGGWDKIQKIFDRFKDGLQAVRNKFSDVKDGIGRTWSALGGTIARPINTVIGTVNDFLEKLRKGLNKIPGVNISRSWGVIPTVPVPAGTTSSASTAGSGRGGAGAQFLASGGPVTGWSPSPTADNIPAWLTAGEYVLPVRAVQALKERFGPGFLENLRRGMPGYAGGGEVGGSVWGAVRSAFGSGWNWLKDIAADSLGWVRKLFGEVMPDFGGSWPGIVAKGAAGSVVDQLAAWVKGKADAASAGQNPAPGSFMSWPYGWRSMFSSGPDFHTGLDFRAPTGTPVKAAGSGRVVVGGGWNHLGGRYVEIAHPSGINSGYFHLSSALARTGQDVAAGQLIGKVGNTGAGSLGPHLHFQTGRGSVWNHFDPKEFLKGAFVADSGAVLAPGLNVLNNKTGGPEPLTRADTLLEALEDLARTTGDEVYAGVRDGMVERARQVRRRTRAEVGSR